MKEVLLEIVLLCLKDAMKQFSNRKTAKNAFKKYKSLIVAQSSIYDSHLGNNNTFEKLKDRFILETIILHVITHIGNEVGAVSRQNSPVYQLGSLYSWYKLPKNIYVNKLLLEIRKTKNPEITIVDNCHQVLSELAGRHIGEFYTPESLVEHLIKKSGFEPDTMINGINVVDPACGGGMILIRIAQLVMEYSNKHKKNNRLAIVNIQNGIYGFDIQPFAVFLSKTMLTWVVGSYEPKSKLDFKNIKLIDPLTQCEKFWRDPIFDYVISNPPFMVIKKDANGFLGNFSQVIYGHPNLYLLFTWWAIKSTRLSGSISLLIPQSMLAGAYFENLRKSINSEAQLLSITRLLERKGAIKHADQQMMIVSLMRGKQKNITSISVEVVKKSTEINKTKPIGIQYKKIIRDSVYSNIWVVSDNVLDYEIEEATCAQSEMLGSISGYKTGNGGYVWNQNKENLIDRFEPGSIPLISSASIAKYSFTFPHNSNHASKNRSFSKVTALLERDLKCGNLLLIQRTTPRKVGRRLIGCIIDTQFTNSYTRFFLENHVNYVTTENNSEFNLFGLLGWLNSDLINFIFQMRNGSTQVSIFELSIMPISLKLTKELAALAELASSGSITKREKTIQEINSFIYEKIGITSKQQKRIGQVLNWKE